MTKRTRATVGAIIEKDGKILLVERNTEPFKGYWAIPGGHIDFGEMAEQAIIREAKEETGLDIKPEFFRYFEEIIDECDWHSVVLVFSCDFSGKEIIDKHIDAEGVKQGEITDLKWFDYKEIKNLKLAFKHKEILDEWFSTK